MNCSFCGRFLPVVLGERRCSANYQVDAVVLDHIRNYAAFCYRPFVCRTCDPQVEFGTKWSLSIHLKVTHQGTVDVQTTSQNSDYLDGLSKLFAKAVILNEKEKRDRLLSPVKHEVDGCSEAEQLMRELLEVPEFSEEDLDQPVPAQTGSSSWSSPEQVIRDGLGSSDEATENEDAEAELQTKITEPDEEKEEKRGCRQTGIIACPQFTNALRKVRIENWVKSKIDVLKCHFPGCSSTISSGKVYNHIYRHLRKPLFLCPVTTCPNHVKGFPCCGKVHVHATKKHPELRRSNQKDFIDRRCDYDEELAGVTLKCFGTVGKRSFHSTKIKSSLASKTKSCCSVPAKCKNADALTKPLLASRDREETIGPVHKTSSVNPKFCHSRRPEKLKESCPKFFRALEKVRLGRWQDRRLKPIGYLKCRFPKCSSGTNYGNVCNHIYSHFQKPLFCCPVTSCSVHINGYKTHKSVQEHVGREHPELGRVTMADLPDRKKDYDEELAEIATKCFLDSDGSTRKESMSDVSSEGDNSEYIEPQPTSNSQAVIESNQTTGDNLEFQPENCALCSLLEPNGRVYTQLTEKQHHAKAHAQQGNVEDVSAVFKRCFSIGTELHYKHNMGVAGAADGILPSSERKSEKKPRGRPAGHFVKQAELRKVIGTMRTNFISRWGSCANVSCALCPEGDHVLLPQTERMIYHLYGHIEKQPFQCLVPGCRYKGAKLWFTVQKHCAVKHPNVNPAKSYVDRRDEMEADLVEMAKKCYWSCAAE